MRQSSIRQIERQPREQEDAQIITRQINQIESSIAYEQLRKLFERDDECDNQAALQEAEPPDFHRRAIHRHVQDKRKTAHQEEMSDLIRVRRLAYEFKEKLKSLLVCEKDDHAQDQ